MYVLNEFRSICFARSITDLEYNKAEKELRFIEKVFNEAYLLSTYKDYMINSSILSVVLFFITVLFYTMDFIPTDHLVVPYIHLKTCSLFIYSSKRVSSFPLNFAL